MTFSFRPRSGLIIVLAHIEGEYGGADVNLALDTGSVHSLISRDIALLLGYDLSIVTSQTRMITASSIETVPRIPLRRINTLGQERLNFLVTCHTLPRSASVDGLLDLDFFRDRRLTIDFNLGTVTVE